MEFWLFVFAAIQAIGVMLTFFRVDVALLKSMHVPINSVGPTRREKFMVSLAVGSLVLCTIGFYGQSASKVPATIVILQATPTIGETKPGMPLSVNVRAIHNGPLSVVQDVNWDATVFITAPLLESAELATFEEFKKNSRQSDMRDMSAGEFQWRTFQTRNLSSDDIKNFQNGSLFVYVMASLRYRDIKGKWTQDFCETLQPPLPVDPQPVWRGCKAIKEKVRPD